MKKLVVISIMAAMLLAVSVAAMADANNWQFSLKASDSNGMNFNTAINIGCQSTFTDLKDSAKGEPGSLGSPTVGKIIASVAAILPDTQQLAARDFREPMTAVGALTEKVWSFKLYVLDNQSVNPLNGFKLTVTPSTAVAPVYQINGQEYTYTWTASFIEGGSQTFSSTSKMPTSWSWDVATGPVNAGDIGTLTLKVAPVPEPSSMLALASGLVGMAGFAIRRRRA